MEREDSGEARVQSFCVFMGISVCVSRCLQSRCSARGRLHDLFLFSGTTQTPRPACFPLIYPLPPPSSRLPHLLSLTPRQLTPFLLCSLPSLDSSSRYRSAAFPPCACVYAHKPLSLLPRFRRSSALLPDLRRGRAHLLITVAHLRPRRLS